ncbi:cation diffusion facilitator family transporter [Granulicella tundricola]|uniref:Cation diffusion facilitator family transporter n=1 Tax=Granulicella tundricola (strain ATCC BAA-1859 / DSM 23138 / MP5ACTX9) TaxID=1198114 RepID=E8WXE1_GRATM|nr:cation diffusion facilitator family transporter [Granulicella tundricola]ADW67474.1 cation diffusion facilitator family transporter [Granulicella tundricola MP5ACTX9]
MHMVASNNRTMQRILKTSLALTAAYVITTFYFGLRAHSLALISEAGHNVSDMLAIILSFVAVYFQSRPANDHKTFGYQRAGVLAAFVNALTLIVLAAWIAISALHRLYAPVTVQPRLMMYVAVAGVLMNGLIATLLWKFSGDVNIRSVFLHMLGDTLSTAAVIAGGAAILFTGLQWIDPVLSLIIAGMIMISSYGIVRDTLNILLEGTPKNLSLPDIRTAIESVEGVNGVHDLHVWSLGSKSHALASHVLVSEMPMSDCTHILDSIQNALWDKFHISHTTIQFETRGCETTHGCSAPPELEIAGAHSHDHSHHGHSH